MLSTMLLMVLPAAMVLAAVSDLTTLRIPNAISLVLVVGFLLAAPLSDLPLATLAAHLGIALIVLTAGFIAFLRGLVGGGDAKLLAAGALWIGPATQLDFLLLVAILGGVLCLAILTFRRSIPAAFVRAPGWLVRLHEPGTGVPYGLAIAGAALALFPETALFRALSIA